ncbi:sensor histidine kinase [Poriferisphaera sp. WC338]|uniref:sensor histidine kinase n=1 Tax=Poriferisphaera sp. WC338 TaxID=3425129 RepID=UPI003D8188B8
MESSHATAQDRRPGVNWSVPVVAGITAAILIGAMLGSGYLWTSNQKSMAMKQRRGELISAANVLSYFTEQALGEGDLTTARKAVVDAAEQFHLSSCQIRLKNGDVVAAMNPKIVINDHINLKTNNSGRSRPSSIQDAVSIVDEGETIVVTHHLQAGANGTFVLELTGELISDPSIWETQAGAGAIGAGSLLLLLLVYNKAGQRYKAMTRIREALLSQKEGECSHGALDVSTKFGDEATAWNQLIREQQMLKDQMAVRGVKESLGVGAAGAGDLAGGCDAMSQGLILMDHQLKINYANHAASVFLRTDYKEMIGQLMLSYINHDALGVAMHEAASGMIRRRVNLELYTDEIMQDSEEDKPKGHDNRGVLRFSILPLKQGNTPSVMLVIEDITQQRVAEEARHEFVAQATHELRTPLTNIRLYLETAIDDGDSDPKMRENCLNVINQETGRLERIVSDMLSVAEIEAGSMQLTRDDVRVEDEISTIERDYQALAEEKKISLIFERPPKLPVIQGDREKIIGALHNLIGNALKYTPDGGRVNVIVESSDRELSVEVRDTGLGISEQDQKHVFEKFYRAQDRRIKGITGSGLGLALAREMVRMHGGDITLESELDQGSTFTMTIPLQVGVGR